METFLCLKSHFSFFPRPLGAFQGHRQGIVAASPYCTGISTCPIFGPQGGWNQEPSATLLGMINICSHAPISLKVVHFCWPQGGAVVWKQRRLLHFSILSTVRWQRLGFILGHLYFEICLFAHCCALWDTQRSHVHTSHTRCIRSTEKYA